MRLLGFLCCVMLTICLSGEAKGQRTRFRRGTRRFMYKPSQGQCTDSNTSGTRVNGESWLEGRNRRVEYCRCAGRRIQCHAVPTVECSKVKCYNGGRCRKALYSHHFVCQCPDGFSGPRCEIDTQAHCALGHGASYRGTWSVSLSGYTCLNWNSSAVAHTVYNARRPGALRLGLGNHNFCRNPDNDGAPWCHVYKHQVLTWETCDIPTCPQNRRSECYTGIGVDYRGTKDSSLSGRPCLSWDSLALRKKRNNAWTAGARKLGLGSHNFCRNPDKDSQPWCHVRKGRHVTWEYCDVKRCPVSVETCGKRRPKPVQYRIKGGIPTDISSHPWQAAIFLYSDKSDTDGLLCGGSLIGSCWVLTAAHCFYERFAVERLKVIMGRTFRAETSPNEQILHVEKYFIHEDFVDRTKDNDIALIKLKPRVGQQCAVPTQFVNTVCLPEAGLELPDWTECEISGYGKESQNSPFYSKRLKEGNVRLVPRSKCLASHTNTLPITNNMLCAQDTRNLDDACQGDSGGPLVCPKDGLINLYGIISWGDGCGKVDRPGVYTKVTVFLQWIYQHMDMRLY
uniref:Plasminogen activator n=1 Tax=Callorhinchus milii TaxID=7868 RepID=V9KK65_CALMI